MLFLQGLLNVVVGLGLTLFLVGETGLDFLVLEISFALDLLVVSKKQIEFLDIRLLSRNNGLLLGLRWHGLLFWHPSLRLLRLLTLGVALEHRRTFQPRVLLLNASLHLPIFGLLGRLNLVLLLKFGEELRKVRLRLQENVLFF
jgi:hypothetical protein